MSSPSAASAYTPALQRALDAVHAELTQTTRQRAPAALAGQLTRQLTNSTQSLSSDSALHLVMNDLAAVLAGAQSACTPAEWESVCQLARSHPTFRLLQNDPFSRRAVEKPRGYAGDAAMLDYIYYGCPPAELASLSSEGQRVHAWSRLTTVPVRTRAEFIGQVLDDLLATRSGPVRVLSIAAGHARELLTSVLARTRTDLSVVLLDADGDSLAQGKRELAEVWLRGEDRIECLKRPISRLLRSDPTTLAQQLGQFDLVYSCGLYDYLDDRTAARLATTMVQQLTRPGGKTIIANFAPHARGAYMDVMLQWKLVYRTPKQMEQITQAAVETVAGSHRRIYMDDHGVILYAEIQRPASAGVCAKTLTRTSSNDCSGTGTSNNLVPRQSPESRALAQRLQAASLQCHVPQQTHIRSSL